ncbi:hypothetical protein GCM10022290_36530 [Sagittula marina]
MEKSLILAAFTAAKRERKDGTVSRGAGSGRRGREKGIGFHIGLVLDTMREQSRLVER